VMFNQSEREKGEGGRGNFFVLRGRDQKGRKGKKGDWAPKSPRGRGGENMTPP